MRLATTLAVALCVALPAPIAANASEGVTGMHKHRVHTHQVVRGSFKAATALAPPFAIVQIAPRPPSDMANVEGYYAGGDAGFSWEPYGWRCDD